MNAFDFGAQLAEKIASGPGMPQSMISSPKPPQPPKPPLPPTYNPAPDKLNLPSTGQTLGNMASNAGRVSGGILSTVAGGIGTAATGAVAGLTNAWNDATPKSMNTSQGWSQGVNSVADKAFDFTRAGVKDVVGGLGGDTNYGTQHSWNQMEKGFNDPNIDSTSRNIAATAAHGGHAAWNIAQLAAAPGKILTNAPRAGVSPLTWARQGSRLMPGARGGVQSNQTAARAFGAGLNKPIQAASMTAGGTSLGVNGSAYASQNLQSAQGTPPSQPQQNNYWDDHSQLESNRHLQNVTSGNFDTFSYAGN